MKYHPIVIVGIILFLLLGSHPIVLSENSEIVSQVRVPSDEILILIENHFKSIQRNAKEGKISAEIASEAEKSYTELQKYLVRSRAEVQVLRIDLMTAKDPKDRERIINDMSQLFAERESNKLLCWDKLRAIEDNSHSKPIGAVPTTPQSTKKLDQQQNQPAQSSTSENKLIERELDIEIVIEAEDISAGERE